MKVVYFMNNIQDGYGVSLAFSCLLDIIRSVGLIIDQSQPEEKVALSLFAGKGIYEASGIGNLPRNEGRKKCSLWLGRF